MEQRIYDMVIIGGGPGGYTAALYAARAGLNVVVLEKLSPGGQMALTTQVDNFPGVAPGIDGYTLGETMQRNAESFGAVTDGLSRPSEGTEGETEGISPPLSSSPKDGTSSSAISPKNFLTRLSERPCSRTIAMYEPNTSCQ